MACSSRSACSARTLSRAPGFSSGGLWQAQVGTHVEQIVLDTANQLALGRLGKLADEQTENRVQFIDAAVGGDARMVLGNSAAVAQAGFASIAAFGIDTGEIDHDNLLFFGKGNNSVHGFIGPCAELCHEKKSVTINTRASFAGQRGRVVWPTEFAALFCVAGASNAATQPETAAFLARQRSWRPLLSGNQRGQVTLLLLVGVGCARC